MPWSKSNVNQSSPEPAERIVAGLSYLTFGLVGLLYIIITGRNGQTPFFRFHFLQSIILGILGLLFSWATSIFVSLLAGILGILGPAVAVNAESIVVISVNVIGKAAYLLLPYGMIWAFMGKYAHIPFISKLVYQQMR